MKETLLMRVQPLCYCVTFASRKTPLLIHGKTNDAEMALFITTTTCIHVHVCYKIIFVKIILTDLLTIRIDVAIVQTDDKIFPTDRQTVRKDANLFERIGKPFEQILIFVKWIGKPFEQLITHFKWLS